MHAKVFSIQIFQYLPRVCTLVLFIILVNVVVPRVCVPVCSFFPPRASRSRRTYVFTAAKKTLLYIIIVMFAENASSKCYGVICLPRMPLTSYYALEPQNTDTNGIHATYVRGHDITIRGFN